MSLPSRTELDQAVQKEIVRRVVAVAQPERVILFGSAARGQMGPHSDVDLLVVKSGDYHKRALAVEIRRALRGIPEAFDILLARPEELERFKDSIGLVYGPALRDGAVLYAA